MIRVTYQYGSTRRATVEIGRFRPEGLDPRAMDGQMLKDDQGEMHICVGPQCADYTAKNGDSGTLTFTKGGPTGGFWKFVKDP